MFNGTFFLYFYFQQTKYICIFCFFILNAHSGIFFIFSIRQCALKMLKVEKIWYLFAHAYKNIGFFILSIFVVYFRAHQECGVLHTIVTNI